MKKTILLIDDDADFRKSVKAVLEKAGFSCSESDSASQGLKAMAQSKPDLVVLDIMLEDLGSGFRFLKTWRNQEKNNGNGHIPVVVLTGIQTLTELKFADRLGTDIFPAEGVLNKPVEPSVLVDTVNKLLKTK
jgi:CheY-like chemotaxis protein